MSALSFLATNGNGGNTAFSIDTFSQDEIKVYVNEVLKQEGSGNDYQISNYTATGGTIAWVGTAPTSNDRIRIVRQTKILNNGGNAVEGKATYSAGAAVKATDLNNNTKQALRSLQEHNDQLIQTYDIQGDAITNAKIADDQIDSEHYVDGSIDHQHLSNDCIDGDNIQDDVINSEHYVAGSIDEEHLANSAVSQNKLASNSVGTSQLINGSVNSDKILDGTIVNADVNASAAIAGTKISPDFGSQNIATTGTINNVTTTELAILDGATVTTNELNILDGVTSTASELNILDGVTANATEINKLDGLTATTAELNHVDGVTSNVQTQLDGKQPLNTNLSVMSTMGSATASALTNLNQAEVQILDDATVTTTEINILDGATVTTNELNILDGVTANATEINLLDGKSVVTSIAGNATDAQLPSAQAVNERIVELVTEVGGFHPIANETSFPATNPDINDGAGTIVSIKALSNSFTTGSGVTTHTFTNGAGSGNNVTITGLTQSTTFPAGRGMLVETTSTLHTYVFHRLTLDETGVADAQAAINDFDERYYGALSTNPATRPSGANRQNGDLYFNTSDGKMKVYNGSHASGTWDDVAAPGNFFINTLSSSSGSGGGQSAFNGTATRFTLSNPPLTAQQLLVSVNGVVQKPNSGTSPSEGFAIDGADIIFASAPATNAPFFIVTIGSSVNIGTPSDNTVTSAKIVDGTIVNADISSSAAIAGSKISPDFGSQNILTTGRILLGTTTEGAVNADELTIASTGNTGMTLRSPSTGSGNIFFSSATSGTSDAAGFITYGHNNGDLSFGTGTDERMRIDTNGLVMIGTTTEGFADFGDDLTLSSSGNTGISIRSGTTHRGSIFFSDATSGDAEKEGFIQYNHDDGRLVFGTTQTERVRIDGSGNVGIGTTSPASTLHLDASGGAVLRLQRTSSNATNKIEISHDGTDGTLESTNATLFRNSGSERMRIDQHGRLFVGTTSTSLGNSGVIGEFCLRGGTEGAAIHMADNDANVHAGFFTTDNSNYFVIRTITNHPMIFRTNNTERMRIAADGKVGIDTTSPSCLLHVDTGTTTTTALQLSNDDNTAYSTAAEGHLNTVLSLQSTTTTGQNDQSVGIQFSLGLSGQTGSIQEIGAVRTGNGEGALIFRTRHSSHGRTERVRFGDNADVIFRGSVNNTSNTEFEFLSSTTSPYARFNHTANNANHTFIQFRANASQVGEIKDDGDGTITYSTTSDYRLKENVVDLSDAITRIKNLKPRRFNFKIAPSYTKDGFLAHELQEVVPEAVQGTKDELVTETSKANFPSLSDKEVGDPVYQTADVSRVVPLLTAALQEAIAKIETLETKVTALEAA